MLILVLNFTLVLSCSFLSCLEVIVVRYDVCENHDEDYVHVYDHDVFSPLPPNHDSDGNGTGTGAGIGAGTGNNAGTGKWVHCALCKTEASTQYSI